MIHSFLDVQNISKTFHPGRDVQVAALVNVTLTFNRGEFVVIHGPSGSGKTTLLNVMGGLDSPTSGEVILDNEKITGVEEKHLSRLRRDHIGFVFQAYNLIPVLTAKENIEYVMQLQGRSRSECEQRSREVAEKLAIAELLGKLPGEMSGGQQQRVAVARAVASRPKLILADEPTANLDSKSATGLMDMMQALNEDEGITIIFSSHDPLVIGKAKHSILLKDGEVAADEFPG
ncbi:MAG: ABC transporter ATP-binding protein [Desulfurivibrio sp.]|nr:MAG: ABC transporter ATP-binding protein [Desulfurivibrio sp.]